MNAVYAFLKLYPPLAAWAVITAAALLPYAAKPNPPGEITDLDGHPNPTDTP